MYTNAFFYTLIRTKIFSEIEKLKSIINNEKSKSIMILEGDQEKFYC